MSEPIIVSYSVDGTRLSKFDNHSSKIDAKFYLGDKQFNEHSASSMNIIFN